MMDSYSIIRGGMALNKVFFQFVSGSPDVEITPRG
jgi:hypothetical protein